VVIGLGRRSSSAAADCLYLLRYLINDTEPEVAARTARLRRRRAEVDVEIARLAAGDTPVRDDAAVQPNHFQGHRRRALAEHLPRLRLSASQGHQRAQLHQLRFAPDRRQVRRPHVPYIEAKNASAHFEHEAKTSKISDDKLFYCRQRGLSEEQAVALIVNGFVRNVLLR
jgi:hypothetical protein